MFIGVWVGVWRPTPKCHATKVAVPAGNSSSKANPISAGGRLSRLSLWSGFDVVAWSRNPQMQGLRVWESFLPVLGDAQVLVLVGARVRLYTSARTRTGLRTCDA